MAWWRILRRRIRKSVLGEGGGGTVRRAASGEAEPRSLRTTIRGQISKRDAALPGISPVFRAP